MVCTYFYVKRYLNEAYFSESSQNQLAVIIGCSVGGSIVVFVIIIIIRSQRNRILAENLQVTAVDLPPPLPPRWDEKGYDVAQHNTDTTWSRGDYDTGSMEQVYSNAYDYEELTRPRLYNYENPNNFLKSYNPGLSRTFQSLVYESPERDV